MVCLNSSDSFVIFYKQKLIRLTQSYLQEFSLIGLMVLNNQLETYVIDIHDWS